MQKNIPCISFHITIKFILLQQIIIIQIKKKFWCTTMLFLLLGAIRSPYHLTQNIYIFLFKGIYCIKLSTVVIVVVIRICMCQYTNFRLVKSFWFKRSWNVYRDQNECRSLLMVMMMNKKDARISMLLISKAFQSEPVDFFHAFS